jgi:hypothetical protein
MKPEAVFLKQATGDMLKGVGGLEAAAAFCRVGKSVLSDCQSVNNPDRFIAIDVVADLEPLAREREGWPHVTRALCTLMGGTFVALPDGAVTRVDLLGSLGRLAQENADISTKLCAALADGVCRAAEARVVRHEVAQAQAVLAALDAQLAAIEGGR